MRSSGVKLARRRKPVAGGVDLFAALAKPTGPARRTAGSPRGLVRAGTMSHSRCPGRCPAETCWQKNVPSVRNRQLQRCRLSLNEPARNQAFRRQQWTIPPTACRPEGHGERPRPEGPWREDELRQEGARGGQQVRWRAALWLQGREAGRPGDRIRHDPVDEAEDERIGGRQEGSDRPARGCFSRRAERSCRAFR